MGFAKRVFAIVLALALCLGICVTAHAEDSDLQSLTTEDKAEVLTKLGLFKGKADKQGNVSPALEDEANRAEAATMLIRLMGREGKAKAQYDSGALKCIFDDVQPWAAATVAWLYEGNYINGMGGTTFGSKKTVTAQQYATMVLRALGYNEADGDFKYADALSFAVEKGLLTNEQRDAYQKDFRRGGMVEMSYNALFLNMKFSALTLKEKLTRDGVFSNIDMSVSGAHEMQLTLKYSAGGKTNPTYFEEKAFGNAVCGDVDGDGKLEIVYGIRSIMCIDAASGALEWRVASGHDITETDINPALDYAGEAFIYAPPFQLIDYDGDGKDEIFTVTSVAGTTKCNIAIYDGSGTYKTHWTTDRRVWAACVEDLDGDGKCEVAIGYGVGKIGMDGVSSIYLYNNDGSVRWSVPCGYGMFSDSIAAVDLDGDGSKELVLLYDDNGIIAYHADGSEVTADAYGGKEWSKILFYEAVDERQPYTTREKGIGLMGTHSGIIADDLDGDGRQELVCTGMFVLMGIVEDNMANGNGVSFDDSAQYFGAFILNPDRTRYMNKAKGYDWTHIPTDLGKIVSIDNPVMDQPSLRPTAADLDGDGEKEILFSSYDGKVHCLHLDGIEHGAWPYALDSRSSAVLTFASQPAVADLNGDGKKEVIFATYTQSDQVEERGKLYVLDYSGKVLAETVLPPMFTLEKDTVYPNGSRNQPCIADFDGDGQLEIAVTTYSCGVCVYELN